MFSIKSSKASHEILLSPAAYRDGSRQAEDNFKLLRLIAALFVLIGHLGWVFYGAIPDHATFVLFCTNNARLAVIAFFAISGFLIAHSLTSNRSFTRFLISRALRIFPALFLVSVIIAFVLGPLLTTAPIQDYFAAWASFAYVPSTSLGAPDMRLPGLFETLPSKGEVNISIWTLRYSALAYIAVGLLFMRGFMRRQFVLYWIAVALGVYTLITFATGLRSTYHPIDHLLNMGLAFVTGTILYVYRTKIPFHGLIALVLCVLAYGIKSSVFYEITSIAAVSYSVIWMGLRKTAYVSSFNKFGDYSYGLFLSHWPIGQSFMVLGIAGSYEMLIAMVLPIAALSSFILWHLVEKPSMAALNPICRWTDRNLAPLQNSIKNAWIHLVVAPMEHDDKWNERAMGLDKANANQDTDLVLLQQFKNRLSDGSTLSNKA